MFKQTFKDQQTYMIDIVRTTSTIVSHVSLTSFNVQ